MRRALLVCALLLSCAVPAVADQVCFRINPFADFLIVNYQFDREIGLASIQADWLSSPFYDLKGGGTGAIADPATGAVAINLVFSNADERFFNNNRSGTMRGIVNPGLTGPCDFTFGGASVIFFRACNFTPVLCPHPGPLARGDTSALPELDGEPAGLSRD